MKNIEKFSVANLDTREMRDINGGEPITAIIIAVCAVASLAAGAAYYAGKAYYYATH